MTLVDTRAPLVVADLGQSNFGPFGQPIWANPFLLCVGVLLVLLCVVVCCCVSVCCCQCVLLVCCCLCVVVCLLCVVCCVLGVRCRRWCGYFGPSGSLPSAGPPCVGPPCAGPPHSSPKFRAFFLSHTIFALFVSLGVFSWNFGGVFEDRSP